MEDRIVGPLTLIQFVYCLVGGLICYIIFQLLANYMILVVLIDLPIALVAVALAFLKIQDQPLSHFITAGLQFFKRPKVRYWKREGINRTIIFEPAKTIQTEVVAVPVKKIEKSNLEKLAYSLDTKPMDAAEEQNFGKITLNFEKMINSAMKSKEFSKLVHNQGGQSGAVGQTQSNRR